MFEDRLGIIFYPLTHHFLVTSNTLYHAFTYLAKPLLTVPNMQDNSGKSPVDYAKEFGLDQKINLVEIKAKMLGKAATMPRLTSGDSTDDLLAPLLKKDPATSRKSGSRHH